MPFLASASTQIVLAVFTVIGVIALDATRHDGGLALLAFVGALAVACAVWGKRLPVYFRVLATGATLYLGYGLCLAGRTMEPGLTPHTFQMAMFLFLIYASLPTLALLRVWRGKLRIGIIAGMFPASMLLAMCVASYEELRFIRDHPNGSGPTPRWTISQHWLSYDAQTRVLSGSD